MTPLESRLPEDPGYWDALAGRIAADAAQTLARLEARRGSWWSTLARGCPALAAAAAVAVAAASIALASARSTTPGSPYSEVARAIGPTDEVGRLFYAESSPPTVEALMPVLARSEADR